MLETAFATLSAMLVLLLCVLIGYFLRAKKILPENADRTISRLESYVILPVLSFSTFMENCTQETIFQDGKNMLYSALGITVAMCIAIPLSKLFSKDDEYKRCVYKYALTFSNFGFVGYAVVPAVLGNSDPQILYKYMLFVLPLNLVAYSWGAATLIPKGKKGESPLKRLLNPIIIGVLLGVVFGLTGAKNYIPGFVLQTIDYCKACMAPLGMILTGIVIASYPFKDLLKDKKVYIATFLRLIVLPIIMVALMYIIKAPKIVLIMTFFAFGTPLGMNTVVFPAAYGGDAKTGASMVMISHTICVITIPIMYALLTLLIK